ncbi:MAG: cupin domain-containing protein [Pseudomonadota bacterium]
MTELNAESIITRLGLQPHPEGGHFTETFRDAFSTAIVFLLQAGEISRWHRVKGSVEIWHFHAGAPLSLALSANGSERESHILGCDLVAGQLPQLTVPEGAWQMAESLGSWTLVSCTVAPAFEFARFELAPDHWQPGQPVSPRG